MVEAILPESDDDAVRIMTVHASKGLEFPIVVLSGLNVADRSRRSGVDVLWRESSPEVRLSKQASTPGYAQLATVEDTMESYEQLRLLYVAATRARDHLIVSLHHKRGTSCHAARLAGQSEAVSALWRRLHGVPAESAAADESWSPTLDLIFADDTGPATPGTPPASSASSPARAPLIAGRLPRGRRPAARYGRRPTAVDRPAGRTGRRRGTAANPVRHRSGPVGRANAPGRPTRTGSHRRSPRTRSRPIWT